MKHTFTLKGLFMGLTVLASSIVFAQHPTSVAPSNKCEVIEDFNDRSGDYRSPSIFTESDYTEFNWDSTAGMWVERSGLAVRSASIISCVYINQQPSGGIDIGWRYKACAGGQYRVRIINVACNCVAGYDIVGTTANGPVWTNFPSDSGRLCIRINDADLYQGQKFRIEISYRGNVPCDWEFDDISLGGDQGAIILPVTFMGINARKETAGTRVQWDVADEVDVQRYEIERSEDGRNFTRIGTVPANKKPAYNFTDANASSGTVYYRVKNVDIDGRFKYSSIAKLTGKSSSIVLKAFPLPAHNQLTVQHDKMTGGMLSLATADGRIVRNLVAASGSIQTQIDLNGLTPGLYILRVDDGNGNVESMKVVKQ
ncbi:T9SS type A sorting domain-containing protein [Flaviaesturariibacter aridisoli]|uniref:T9SS type A sorting domain-containing protein n=1 Tax=Flaviaesturariibacter aridisoli TaxID=2545761 RepID=A0A4R4E3I0_9BACT|nr:T9SS type A sorting domain-containing protein [Flaviaesturariibacter aridisoli]TCZ70570.1 T9SS type A sorting domain-containing protein [Flaviaesturariibacter aridisoli]